MGHPSPNVPDGNGPAPLLTWEKERSVRRAQKRRCRDPAHHWAEEATCQAAGTHTNSHHQRRGKPDNRAASNQQRRSYHMKGTHPRPPSAQPQPIPLQQQGGFRLRQGNAQYAPAWHEDTDPWREGGELAPENKLHDIRECHSRSPRLPQQGDRRTSNTNKGEPAEHNPHNNRRSNTGKLDRSTRRPETWPTTRLPTPCGGAVGNSANPGRPNRWGTPGRSRQPINDVPNPHQTATADGRPHQDQQPAAAGPRGSRNTSNPQHAQPRKQLAPHNHDHKQTSSTAGRCGGTSRNNHQATKQAPPQTRKTVASSADAAEHLSTKRPDAAEANPNKGERASSSTEIPAAAQASTIAALRGAVHATAAQLRLIREVASSLPGPEGTVVVNICANALNMLRQADTTAGMTGGEHTAHLRRSDGHGGSIQQCHKHESAKRRSARQ